MLEVEEAEVKFDGIVALNKVSIQFEVGVINAVIGPNGSGKSTLFNAITGFVPLFSGSVRLAGSLISALRPPERICAGIARTFQTPRFDPNITVEEAVLCGFYPQSKSGLFAQMLRSRAVRSGEADAKAACIDILRDLGLIHLRSTSIGQLPMGQVRLVEVARAIANQPQYILLDEPAAGLTRDEQKLLAKELRRLKDRGIGVVLVEHNFELVCDIASRIVVLNRGTILASGTPNQIRQNDAFVEAYLGSFSKKLSEDGAHG